MKTYLTFNDIYFDNYGGLENHYYHHELDRYVIFDSDEEWEAHKDKVTKAQAGGFDRPLTLLNTSILTDFGKYDYQPVRADYAASLARAFHGCGKLQSAIGHQATAAVLSELLGVPVEMNRIAYVQPVGHVALVFKLKGRVPEGTILSREQIDAMGYDFGLMTRLASAASADHNSPLAQGTSST
jgi:STIV B116-like